ncbi:MAG: NRDE family protein [Alphaproteobacteria bacterium]
MCTVVILRRPGHRWPLILGANRDELVARPSRPPAAHWPRQPDVIGGQDVMAGGTWLGINGAGVVAAVMNRVGSLGPAADKASRGELPLLALEKTDAAAAAAAVAALDGGRYRTFNLVVADAREGFWLRWAEGARAIERFALPDGVSMVTAHDRNDGASRRIRRFLPCFAAATPPEPPASWGAWQRLLGSRAYDPDGGPTDAMTIAPTGGFGTVSSSLVALGDDGAVIWRYAGGAPDIVPFRDVALTA